MRRVLAIARLTVAAGVRSRVFVAIAVLLFFSLIAVPVAVKHDGTLEGRARVLLYYNLNISFILLSVATLWLSSSSRSLGIRSGAMSGSR